MCLIQVFRKHLNINVTQWYIHICPGF
jgi:hypothetical protein